MLVFCTIRESYFLPNMISEMRRDGVLTQDETRSHGREKAFILSDKGELYAADMLKTLDAVESRTPLAVVLWFLFAVVCYLIMPFYARMSAGSEAVIQDVTVYGRSVCVFSFGLFLESIWTKILQSNGDMKTPMFAQIIGAPNILMQSAYTFYILGLNLILATFCDQAVTALGLYYKWQTFFFIPLGAMQTCIVPIISYNYAARNIDRCKKTLSSAVVFGLVLMVFGTLCFLLFPEQLLRVFTKDA